MATRYFADTNTGTVELTNVGYRDAKQTQLVGIDPRNPPVFVKDIGWTGYVNVSRSIEYKSQPSKHVCDARCVNATGKIMKCECSCGGKNHGKGFSCD